MTSAPILDGRGFLSYNAVMCGSRLNWTFESQQPESSTPSEQSETPLVPIVLTTAGETLREYPSFAPTGEHATDADSLFTQHRVGIHDVCGGELDIREVSATHSAILCRLCRLRVTVPKTVVTYGDLRRHFKGHQPKG